MQNNKEVEEPEYINVELNKVVEETEYIELS